MGSSFVSYRGQGFWVRDSSIETWLYFLVQEIDQLSTRPHWLSEAQKHWKLQACGVGVGVLRVGLDDHVISQEQQAVLISLCASALTTLSQFADDLPADFAFKFARHEGMGEWWYGSMAKWARCVGAHMIKLLNGEMVIARSQLVESGCE